MSTLQTSEIISPLTNTQDDTAFAQGRLLNWASLAFVVVVAFAFFSTPLRRPENMLAYAQDDFYYYLIVARNILRGLGSTFDGSTLTNGYHPLYFLLLLGIAKANGSLSSVYARLCIVDVASATGIFLATRTLLGKHLRNPWLTNGFAMAIVYLAFWRICQQMEVTLTLPLGFLLLLAMDRPPRDMTTVRWAGVGLLASILTLSRLDSALLVGLLVLAALVLPEYRASLTLQKVLALAGAYFPLLVAYLGVNRHFFHRLTPISATAKQLARTHWFHMGALRGSFSYQAMVMFLVVLAGLACLPLLWKRLRVELRVIALAVLIFPWVHWGLNLVLSDWLLWPWYRYSLIFALAIVLLFIGQFGWEHLSPQRKRIAGPVVLLGVAAALVSARYSLDGTMFDIAQASRNFQKFAVTHPGRYAMGDRAGMAAYLNPNPTIQLEGLMMDDTFLDHIRRQDHLRDVLRAYNVDYYVVFEWRKKDNWPPPCLQAREPRQAGKDSPAMEDTFCEAPVNSFITPFGRTVVYDLHQASPKLQ